MSLLMLSGNNMETPLLLDLGSCTHVQVLQRCYCKKRDLHDE